LKKEEEDQVLEDKVLEDTEAPENCKVYEPEFEVIEKPKFSDFIKEIKMPSLFEPLAPLEPIFKNDVSCSNIKPL